RASAAAGGSVGAAADHAVRCVEADGERGPDVEDPFLAPGEHRAAVFRPGRDQSIDAALVRPNASGCIALPALRFVERGVRAGAGQFSSGPRASIDAAGDCAVLGLWTR